MPRRRPAAVDLLEAATQRTSSVLRGHLAELVGSVRLGRSWCVDFGASLWERKGLDPATLRAAVSWPARGSARARHAR